MRLRLRHITRWIQRYRWWLTGSLVVLLVVYWHSLPDRLFEDPTCTVIEDREGVLLGARIAADGQWRFPHNAQVPPKLAQAIVQFEDRDFYDHPGISAKAFGRALKQNVQAGRVVSGGSTITMQVVRLMRGNRPRTVLEKCFEVVLATRLELRYSKEEILAFWASNAPFGGNVVGLDAAAWRYFGRSADQLSWSESATLAVLPNAPSLIYPGKNQERLRAKRNRLLQRLHEVQLLDSISLHLAQMEALPEKPHALPRLAPHLLDRADREGHRGARLLTTVDRSLQQHVLHTVDIHHRQLRENGIHNAAVLVLSVASGDVLAYVGNTQGTAAEHGHAVDVIRAPRSTGSILKPFLYASMLDDGQLTPDMLVPDVPTQYGGYAPKNYNQSYDGAVPARRALARSLNVPAVRMLQDYGIDRFHHRLRALGMSTLHRPPEDYGLSLILGGAEATLWDLASIYAGMGRTLLQYPGYTSDLRAKPHYRMHRPAPDNAGLEAVTPLVQAGAVWHTLEAMLEVTRPEEDINWRAFASSRKIAWKTGTSFGFRDAWAIGLTPDHVVAVWVGNADGEGRPGLVGLEAAAPLLFDVFDRLPHAGWFAPPYDNMAQVPVCRQSGHRVSEWCEHSEMAWIPETSLRTAACPYHQLVHLDATATWRVDSECEDVADMVPRSWFVLPPVMEWYYQYNHPHYKTLPPYRADCEATVSDRPMAVIYPKRLSRIKVPVQLDGTVGRTVFQVTHRRRSATIHWHLDEIYLGATRDIHEMELVPHPGRHTLTLVDENGQSISRNFEVVGEAS